MSPRIIIAWEHVFFLTWSFQAYFCRLLRPLGKGKAAAHCAALEPLPPTRSRQGLQKGERESSRGPGVSGGRVSGCQEQGGDRLVVTRLISPGLSRRAPDRVQFAPAASPRFPDPWAGT